MASRKWKSIKSGIATAFLCTVSARLNMSLIEIVFRLLYFFVPCDISQAMMVLVPCLYRT